MSYDIDELFRFEKTEGGYALAKYLKICDPTVTELDIPAEYNGLPVVIILDGAVSCAEYIKRVSIPGSVRDIMYSAFCFCSLLEEVEFSEGLETIEDHAFSFSGLKSVKFPKSLILLRVGAFECCKNLERVEFNSTPEIGWNVFSECPKLPPEIVVMGMENRPNQCDDCFRPDVFELFAKRNCFRNYYDLEHLFKRMIDENKAELIPVAEQYGMLEDVKLVDWLISYAAERQATECTAYLLELKKRKFGFNGGNDFEL